ncbi:MAG: LPXTG cell wall anchor domain-containing protein, partial [Limosilactobacillus sp.]|uniref:LPXTG cell wall anchor domain-containing protein n=1 Tax=Limosilactobacillus sp. TaxID=2773925 RepID=UPI0026F7AE6C|nr:LPXTG cell wall anchor domain-containing protein [Limosilactobacillus sp.]
FADGSTLKTTVNVDVAEPAVTPVEPGKPDTPGTDQPATPGEDKPTTPGTDQPATPGEDKPTTPGTDQPATPGENNPTKPETDQPVAGKAEALDADTSNATAPEATTEGAVASHTTAANSQADQKKLPQTGDEQSIASIVLGFLLAGLGITVLPRKRTSK